MMSFGQRQNRVSDKLRMQKTNGTTKNVTLQWRNAAGLLKVLEKQHTDPERLLSGKITRKLSRKKKKENIST